MDLHFSIKIIGVMNVIRVQNQITRSDIISISTRKLIKSDLLSMLYIPYISRINGKHWNQLVVASLSVSLLKWHLSCTDSFHMQLKCSLHHSVGPQVFDIAIVTFKWKPLPLAPHTQHNNGGVQSLFFRRFTVRGLCFFLFLPLCHGLWWSICSLE